MMISLHKKTALCSIGLAILIGGCKKDNNTVTAPPNETEQEVITTLKLTFTDLKTNMVTYTALFKDSDGPGGNPPIQFDDIKLSPYTSYQCHVSLENEGKNPAEDITKEIKEKANDHLFAFHNHDVNITITYGDTDDNNLPVGLVTQWQTQQIGKGIVHVILKHQPGIKDGTVAPGETDIELEFTVKVE